MFVTCLEQFIYTHKSIALKNAPAPFLCAINVVLASVELQHATVYVGNIVIFLKTSEDHERYIGEVLRLLIKTGVTIRLKKWHFYSRDIYYLGHLTSLWKLQMAQKTAKSAEASRWATNVSEVKSLLDFCNVYRRFVSSHAHLTTSFNKKLKKAVLFNYNWPPLNSWQ